MDYTPVIDQWRSMEGMMLEPSAVVWCALLEAQNGTWTWDGLKPGDYLEIGVYKGKSGSILAHFSSLYNNKLTLVDPIVRDDTREVLCRICKTIQYINTPSELMWLSQYHKQNIRNLAFAHIDGMHTYTAVMSDMRICEELLDEYGILCIDDFYTELYPQVTVAVHNYLCAKGSDLVIFFQGFNKAYLCRNAARKYYTDYVMENIIYILQAYDNRVTLVKTDSNINYDGLAIVPFQGKQRFGSYVERIK